MPSEEGLSLRSRLSEPGYVVSALVHVGVLAATLIAFSQSEKFDDIQETVPVEVVTDNQFNQIMKGDKSAKEVRPEATAKTEQTASLAAEQPDQPAPEKAATTPPPPPPPPPLPPVRHVEQPKPPASVPPPPPVTALPPPRPEPPTPTATPPIPMPPVRDVEAEPVAPKPEPKPVPKPVVKPVPTPPVVPHPVVAKLPDPKPVPRPRPVEKPKLDQLAKLMEEQPTDSTPPDRTSVSKPPRPSRTVAESKFDPTDISKLLSGNAPAQRASASHDAVHASLGSPTASAPKMSPSFWAGLDGVMEDQYRQCWSYLGLNTGVKYVPQVRVVYGSNGALEADPVLLNPPSDPAMQSLADSAMRAVRRCNPLKIPDQYAPYYDQWKGRVLRFDPEEMAG